LAAGSSLTMSGSLLLANNAAGSTGFLTNNGGALSASATSINPNNVSFSSLLLINGGTNDLGNVSIFRSVAGSSAFSALGSEGLLISNGIVRMTSLNVGNATASSFLTMLVASGAVTNTGDMVVRQFSGSRTSRFLQTGGTFVSSGANGVHMAITNATQITIYSVTGGTNLPTGFIFGDITNNSGTVNLTNAAKIYVGGLGMTSGVIATVNIALNSGGTFGAQADWLGQTPMILAGGSFDAADLGGTAHNITLSAGLRGAGALNKNGAGTLTLGATNTYSGGTIINKGTLALSANGTISKQHTHYHGQRYDVRCIRGHRRIRS